MSESDSITNGNKEFHAHDVLDHLHTCEKALSLDEIKNQILNAFGYDAVFYSCSQQNMNADQMVDFLLSRKKIVEIEEKKYVLNTVHQCNH